jgi:hypothetical protein
MRKTSSIFVALAAALVMAVPASAVQFGSPDGDNHPQVGVVSFFGTSPIFPFPFWRCTGTLIAPSKVLTASHCTAGALYAWAFFDEVVTGNPWDGIPGVPVTKPGFDVFASFPASHDLGMVLLLAPQSGPFAQLAPAGYLDTLKKGSHTSFDIVGYGLQDVKPLVQLRARYAGEARMVNIESSNMAGYNVHLTGSPGTGGAACLGDSGGPVFLGGTSTIVAVQSLGKTHCVGGSVGYRTDTADSLGFINSFAP